MSKKYKILILGGARFHGLFLAKHFYDLGNDVYVLNRGQYKPAYEFEVKHLKADRNKKHQLKNALADHHFDVVIDNNAYNSTQMMSILELIRGKCEHYIFTSTVALYLRLYSKHKICEEEATGIKIGFYHPEVKFYALNKFFAELTLTNYSDKINYTIFRLPPIFGEGDFAGKLLYFYLRLKDGGKLLLEKEVQGFNLIYAHDIVKIYDKAVLNKNCYNRIINIADSHTYTYEEFFSTVYGNLYSNDKLLLLPAEKLWDLGYHLPFAWGPEIDTSLSKKLFGKIDFTSISRWGKKSLKWEIAHLRNKASDLEFKKERENELKIIKRLTNDQ